MRSDPVVQTRAFSGRWGGSGEGVWFLPHLQKDLLLPLMPVANSDFAMLVLQSPANPQEPDLVHACLSEVRE